MIKFPMLLLVPERHPTSLEAAARERISHAAAVISTLNKEGVFVADHLGTTEKEKETKNEKSPSLHGSTALTATKAQ